MSLNQERFDPARLLANHPRYKLVKYIGKGSHGLVVEAEERSTGQRFALKFLNRGDHINKYVEREVLNQFRLKHPHIVSIREVFLTTDHLVLVLGLARGGDLLQHVTQAKRLGEDEARWFLQQIVFALDYSHRMGVSNRDIKLENVLLEDNSARPLVRLSDFGFSKDENYQSAPDSRVGTPAYLAPEVVVNMPGEKYDAKKADVWSCGVMLFTMLAGRYPFARPDDDKLPPGMQLQATLQRILHVSYAFPKTQPLSDECKDLIARMLTREPTQRLSMGEVLRHPWLGLGANPGLLNFNETLVAKTMASLPSPELIREIESIVRDATRPGRVPAAAQGGQQQQQQSRAQPGQPVLGGAAAYGGNPSLVSDSLIGPQSSSLMMDLESPSLEGSMRYDAGGT